LGCATLGTCRILPYCGMKTILLGRGMVLGTWPSMIVYVVVEVMLALVCGVVMLLSTNGRTSPVVMRTLMITP